MYLFLLTLAFSFSLISRADCGAGVAANCTPSVSAADVSVDYQKYLGIAPTASDSALWVGVSRTHTSEETAALIATSPRALSAISDYAFSQTGVRPDAATVAAWANVSAAGGGIAAVQTIISGGADAGAHRMAEVDRLYQSILGRTAVGDPGSAGWVEHLKTETLVQVANEIASSTEAATIIKNAFQAKFNRQPTDAELAQWRPALVAVGRQDFVLGFNNWANQINADSQSHVVSSQPASSTVTDSACLPGYNACILQCTSDACRHACTQESTCVAHPTGSTATTPTSSITITTQNPTRATASVVGAAANAGDPAGGGITAAPGGDSVDLLPTTGNGLFGH